jgi:hypothetical protein
MFQSSNIKRRKRYTKRKKRGRELSGDHKKNIKFGVNKFAFNMRIQ